MSMELSEEEQSFILSVLQGLSDLDEGREMSLADAKKYLRLRQ